MFFDRWQIRRIFEAHVTDDFAVGRSCVADGTAGNDADIEGIAFCPISQVFNVEYFVGHFFDGTAAVFRVVADVRSLAENFQLKLEHAFAFNDDAIIRKPCFKIKGGEGSLCFFHYSDRGFAVRVTDFFIAKQDYFDWMLVPTTFLQGFQSIGQDDDATFHIKHAGTVGFAVFNLKRTLGSSTMFENGIHMTCQYNERFAAVTEFADQHVAGNGKFMNPVFTAHFGKEVCQHTANFVNTFLAAWATFNINHGLPKLQHIILIVVDACICFLFHVHEKITPF